MVFSSSTGDARCAHNEITQALACLDRSEAARLASRYRQPSPRFKPLVLKAAPNARVRRTPARTYECFIGNERISAKGCIGEHSTSNKAWACLARYIVGARK